MTAPPQDLDAERSVLASMLIDPACIPTVRGLLSRRTFYRDANGHLFDALLSLDSRRDAVDAITLCAELKRLGTYGPAGGNETVAGVLEYATTSANVAIHASIVREMALRREVIRLTTEARDKAFDATENAPALATDLSSRLSELAAGSIRSADEHPTDGWESMFSGEPPVYLPLPMRCLDSLHIAPGDLTFIAARPGGGKSAMLCNWAVHAAKHGWRVLFLSVEMAARPIKQRMMANFARKPLSDVVNPLPGDTSMLEHIERMRGIPIRVADSSMGGLYVEDCIARIGKFAGERSPLRPVVFLDYVQYVRSRARFDRKHELVGHVCRELRDATTRWGIPIVAAAQVNREQEKRGKDSLPVLADLKDSGDVEERGDNVVMLQTELGPSPVQTCHLSVQKQRQGPKFVEECWFNSPMVAFEDKPDSI